jgi:peptidyl-dipeptidase Dcp
MSETSQTLAASQAQPNPLLKAWQTPFETPPFSEIAPEHFLPAFEQAFADHAAEIAAIEHDPATPDFNNTVTALERAGKLLSKVSAVFYDLVSADSNPALLEIDKEVSLRMARHWNPIMMNAVVFGRIVLLHNNRSSLGLTGEQMRLLERTYTRFHRAGAGLDESAKKRMAEINERLAHLGTAFSHHLLGDEQGWFLELGEADYDGRPRPRPASAAWPARRS